MHLQPDHLGARFLFLLHGISIAQTPHPHTGLRTRNVAGLWGVKEDGGFLHLVRKKPPSVPTVLPAVGFMDYPLADYSRGARAYPPQTLPQACLQEFLAHKEDSAQDPSVGKSLEPCGVCRTFCFSVSEVADVGVRAR